MDVRSMLGGPAELVLTAAVARRYYLDNCSKMDLADEFGISRFKVARLLEVARSSGLVRIEIDWPGAIDVNLSGQLRERFGLLHAIVIEATDHDAAILRRELGAAAADLLEEVVTSDDVLGVAWARSVSAMTSQLRRLPATPVVQLTGALSLPDSEDSATELVRNVAQLSGGPAYVFYAPLIVPDAATAGVLRSQPEVARAFGQIGSVTKAVVGIGRWAVGQSTVFDATNANERAKLARQGVVADISGVLLYADGSPVDTPLTERMIGITAQQMRVIPEVIAIVYGHEKVPAVLAALRSGLVKGLVTHVPVARAMLDAV
jgi:DNA-binding transcriptional regulator LsrR (DeoR family)